MRLLCYIQFSSDYSFLTSLDWLFRIFDFKTTTTRFNIMNNQRFTTCIKEHEIMSKNLLLRRNFLEVIFALIVVKLNSWRSLPNKDLTFRLTTCKTNKCQYNYKRFSNHPYSAIQIVTRLRSFSANGCTCEPLLS